MTDETKRAFNNALASAKMEGINFTDEQLDELAYFIERVYDDKMTWQEATDSLVRKYKKG